MGDDFVVHVLPEEGSGVEEVEGYSIWASGKVGQLESSFVNGRI